MLEEIWEDEKNTENLRKDVEKFNGIARKQIEWSARIVKFNCLITEWGNLEIMKWGVLEKN